MTTNELNTIGIIGAGAWGTALAQTASMAGNSVRLYAREAELAKAINTHHTNATYLPKIKLDASIIATAQLEDLKKADTLLLVCPAQYVSETVHSLKALGTQAPLVICAKGIDVATQQLLSEVVETLLPQNPLAVLSGPTFANEVACGLPTAVTIASKNEALAAQLCDTLGSRNFRPYSSPDVVGVQVGGAIKNVLAIGCGIVVGKGLGENARAALIARGLAEMLRLSSALGGRTQTLMGLAGLGDIVLTCSSPQSRNMSLGMALGQGRRLEVILAERNSVAEGVATAKAAQALAQKLGVDMPLVSAVHAILHEGADINTTVETLLARPFKSEV